MLNRRLTGSDLIRSMIGPSEGEKEEKEVIISTPYKPKLNRSSLSLEFSLGSPVDDKMASLVSVQEEEGKDKDASAMNVLGGSGDFIQDNGGGSEVSSLNQSCCSSQNYRHGHTSFPSVPLRSALRTFTATYSSQHSIKPSSHSRQADMAGLITPMNLSHRNRLGTRISAVVFPSNKVSGEAGRRREERGEIHVVTLVCSWVP